MCQDDWTFYNNQKQIPREGFCTSFTDRQWEISNNRKLERMNRSLNQSYPEDYFEKQDACSYKEEMDCEDSLDPDFNPEEPEKKRPKFQYVPVYDHSNDVPFAFEQGISRVKVTFVMSDSTAHNFGVIELVCEELDIEDVPKTLLCNSTH
ncbi:uncharacterized protein [Clytia hemisphaerica]|uniref:uncharacterized protein n=1 Tax=Clytia hemisphaerica TaxID=252671 RepID=UPI0034D62400